MPPSNTKFKVIILWEDEVRIAAKALCELIETQNKEFTEEEIKSSINQALKACYAALQGAEETGACLVMSAKPKRDFV